MMTTKEEFLRKNKITLLQWICIPPPVQKMKNTCRQPMRTLKVFNSKSMKASTLHTMPVEFSTEQIPSDYILYNHTAIFHGNTSQYIADNIYHYIKQYYIPFQHLLEIWKKARLTNDVDLFFPKALDNRCARRPYASFFLAALSQSKATEKYRYSYNSHPGGVCYRYGMLSDSFFYSPSAIDFLRNHYNVSKLQCPEKQLILLQRNSSQIWINIEDNANSLVKAGYKNTKIMDFGNMTLLHQLNSIYCTSLFIEPHSAALQWTYFMRPNSSVIEIAWPALGWPFFYSTHRSRLYGKVPVKFIQFQTKNVTKLQYSMERMLGSEIIKGLTGNITSEENIKKYRPNDAGKHCDYYVDPHELTHVTEKTLPLT